MLAYKALPCNKHALNKLGIANLVPLLSKIERHAQRVVLGQSRGNVRLGHHAKADLAGGHEGRKLRMLCLELNGHVLKPVLLKQIIQNVFGSGALAGGVKRLSRKIRHGIDLVPALKHVKHAEGGNAKHYHVALKLVVKHCGNVYGKSGGVVFTGDESGGHSGRIRADGNVIVGVALLIHEGSDPHARRPLKGGDAYNGIVCNVCLFAGGEGCKRKDHKRRKNDRNKPFHFKAS